MAGWDKMLQPLGIDIWKEENLAVLVAEILNVSSKPLILIDGKAGSGKTSFATKLAENLNANMVATDDVAWWLDPIHWDGELLTGIIEPWQNGENVAYRPSGWMKKDRAGFIMVDASKALVIEGSGACRKTLREMATYSIWVDTDPDVARERVIQRDLANGENGETLEAVTEFTDWWDAILDPFLAAEAAWKHANVIVSGMQSDLSANRLFVHYQNNE